MAMEIFVNISQVPAFVDFLYYGFAQSVLLPSLEFRAVVQLFSKFMQKITYLRKTI